MSRIKKAFIALSMILGCAAAGLFGMARQGYADETATGGLWRDSYGGLWCGGGCARGQACCTFTYQT